MMGSLRGGATLRPGTAAATCPELSSSAPPPARISLVSPQGVSTLLSLGARWRLTAHLTGWGDVSEQVARSVSRRRWS